MPAPLLQPKYIEHEKWCANGTVPDTRFLNLVLRSQNHAMAYRRKTFMVWGDWSNAVSGQSGTVSMWRFRCHTGYGATHMGFQIGMGLDDGGAGTDPTVTIAVTIAGGATTSYVIHAGADASLATEDAPHQVVWLDPKIEVNSNETYEVLISSSDFARPLSICAYEIASDVVDDSVSYFNETQPNTFLPIYGSVREQFLVGLSNMWKRNGSHLYTWAGDGGGTNPTFNSTTWTNIIDGSTTTGAAIPGIILNSDDMLSALIRYSDSSTGTINVVMAVHGSTNTGSTGAVRFYDGTSALCSITNISTVSQWYTSTTTIAGFNNVEKVYVQARDATPNTLTLNAVCLYAYLA